MNVPSPTIKTVLDNGLIVYTSVHQPIKTLTLHCWVFAGPVYENPKNNGVSHFVEHMLFRGNHKLGSSMNMSLKFERLGGQLNAATSFDGTEYWLECHRDYFAQAVSQFLDFIRYPSFEALETERAIILEEIKSDYNEQNQLIDLDQLTANQIWPNQPIGLSISGTPDGVAKLTQAQLIEWYQTYYHPANMILGVSGDFDPTVLAETIQDKTDNWDQGKRFQYAPPVSALRKENQFQWVLDQDNQVQISWTFILEALTPLQRLLLQLLARMLDDGSSSRLQQEVREERGLVYDIQGSPAFFRSGATFTIGATVGKERLLSLIDVLVELIRNVIRTGFTEDELHLATLRLRSELDCFTDTAEGRLHEAVAPVLSPGYFGLDHLNQLLLQVDLGSVNKMASQLLSSTYCCFTFVGPTPKEEQKQVERQLASWKLV